MATAQASNRRRNRSIGLACWLAALGLAFATIGFPAVETHGQQDQGSCSWVDAPQSLELIELPLRRYLEDVRGDESIPVLLILKEQVTPDEKINLFGSIGPADRKQRKQMRREALIDKLRGVAKNPQQDLLGALDTLNSDPQVIITEIRRLWIVNAVAIRANRAAIQRMNGAPSFQAILRSIHLDTPRGARNEAHWNVRQVNADDVWAAQPTGYDGSGVVVAVIDSGVEHDHDQLEDRIWINASEDVDGDGKLGSADDDKSDADGNGYEDDVRGWDFSPETWGNNPIDEGTGTGHGTSVAGIVAGDGSGGKKVTGVAPGASIMVLRDGGELPTEGASWLAMQYALVQAHSIEEEVIINYSTSFLDGSAPAAHAMWRNVVENLMDGGVLFVTAAGNEDSSLGAPCNVPTPGRVPVALAVAATKRNDAIAPFSSRGPVTWQDVPSFCDYPWESERAPGLVKPDLSAPGADVWTVSKGGGQENEYGTSFSAPHAAGVAALLLEQDKDRSAYELKYLLEETAVDLGPEHPDNDSGWGLLEAQAAVGESISSDPYNLSVKDTTVRSMGGDLWVDNNQDGSPDPPIVGDDNYLYARVRNLGGEVVGRVALKFYVADMANAGVEECHFAGDGDPTEAGFDYIGSYVVPLLGPVESKHEHADGLVRWRILQAPGDEWCLAVQASAMSPPGEAGEDPSNNWAFQTISEFARSSGEVEPPVSCADYPGP